MTNPVFAGRLLRDEQAGVGSDELIRAAAQALSATHTLHTYNHVCKLIQQ